VTPSGRLPSVLDRPDGSLTALLLFLLLLLIITIIINCCQAILMWHQGSIQHKVVDIIELSTFSSAMQVIISCRTACQHQIPTKSLNYYSYTLGSKDIKG